MISQPLLSMISAALFFILLTLAVYHAYAKLQQKLKKAWLNPMLLSILTLIPFLLIFNIPFEQYYQATASLNKLLEPAVVALGFPLYQHLQTIKKQWRHIMVLLLVGVFIAISISFIITLLTINQYDIAVSLSLKSVTTPIGIALTEQLNGSNSITAFAIILAGLFGALLGPPWLSLIKVTSPKAQGLAIGAASHALGTATISKVSYEHAAYSSLALIISAVITAIFSPMIINTLVLFLR
ncbi:LrgB-like family protein [Colwellia sp. PAMC 20917]|uniref:LrgB family protein n=1 Tax=unclassified Colwellia TaxID=196834 RepID=UPI0008798BEE|nr:MULTISPECIES: LrgB family protein [unclassified Colwellia]AOW77796.1 LrgB-like family protein [Colwellia sp. PAMC 20917]